MGRRHSTKTRLEAAAICALLASNTEGESEASVSAIKLAERTWRSMCIVLGLDPGLLDAHDALTSDTHHNAWLEAERALVEDLDPKSYGLMPCAAPELPSVEPPSVEPELPQNVGTYTEPHTDAGATVTGSEFGELGGMES